MKAVKMIVLMALVALGGLVGVSDEASADTVRLIHRAEDMSETHPKIAAMHLDFDFKTRDGESPRTTEDIGRDGSDILVAYKVDEAFEGYTGCFRWEAYDLAGASLGVKHACSDWFDGEQHELVLVPGAETANVGKLKLELIILVGDAVAWSGEGDPPEPVLHVEGQTGVDDEDAVQAAAYTRRTVENAVHAKAKGILRCAHPTGKYVGVLIDQFTPLDDGGLKVNYSILYECRLSQRACLLSMAADYSAEGEMRDMEVVFDTARTNPELGLKACEMVLNLLR